MGANALARDDGVHSFIFKSNLMKSSLFIIPVAIALVGSLSTSSLTEWSTGQSNVVTVKKQESPFAFLRTHRQGKGTAVVWGINSTDAIVGFGIQRTYEDPADPYANWEEAGTVQNSAARSFTHKDQQVFPGVIYYRVVAIYADGNTALSEVSSVRIPSR
jgi:hypothetical protein